MDAAEVWHFYRGAPLELCIGKQAYLLGPEIDEAQAPQIVVPPGAWQAARSLGDYTLVGCTVAPGFEFEHFEMAPDGFEPVSRWTRRSLPAKPPRNYCAAHAAVWRIAD